MAIIVCKWTLHAIPLEIHTTSVCRVNSGVGACIENYKNYQKVFNFQSFLSFFFPFIFRLFLFSLFFVLFLVLWFFRFSSPHIFFFVYLAGGRGREGTSPSTSPPPPGHIHKEVTSGHLISPLHWSRHWILGSTLYNSEVNRGNVIFKWNSQVQYNYVNWCWSCHSHTLG